MIQTQDIAYTTDNDLVIGVDAKTGNVLPTTATAYKRGDVVVVDGATNVATHPETATGYHAIVAQDVSAEQATNHAAAGIEIPVYIGGEFNAFECSVDGTKLDKDARLLARAYATNAGLSLTLKLPAGIEDK
ncbi:hypothetical protein ACPESL_07945 [Psychrobacter pocilloporae]|uniref:hypothetical protein n=1 Tax=Psychrobacter pocilloporae TaxID=1775882 RepID=UPI003C2B9232